MQNVLNHWAALDAPAPIQRATYLASRAHFPIALTDAERSLFLELIGRIDARDGQTEFWVRSENLAASIGKSLRTIGSLMASLVDKNLIEKEQARGRWGAFSSLTCKLTHRAVELLGLQVVIPVERSVATRKKTADALSGLPDSFTKTSMRRLKSRSDLPGELHCLFDAGISIPGIFKLMGMATRNRKRLGDVVAAHMQIISKARNPFAYVVKVLLSREQSYEDTQATKESALQREIKVMRAHVAGKEFVTPTGRLARFTQDGVFCELWRREPDCHPTFQRTVGGAELVDLLSKFNDLGWRLTMITTL